MKAPSPFNSPALRGLARAFPAVSERWYVISKMASDPLYDAVFRELAPTSQPLLDVGCGMGVLAFYLRARGWRHRISGLDYDPRKIASARKVADRWGPDTEFNAGDARTGLPDHRGSVTILDILQYFTPDEQRGLLHAAAHRVAPGGRLILRNGLASRNWRSRLTRAGDRLAKATRWMRDHALHYPTADFLDSCLHGAGLTGSLRPLWGRTPFNNWLGVWHHPAPAA
ncbi:MAG: class I SAM-dependent methyltransferase [Verrucomicrobiaceae bacterium]|nr:MAG: class I SAM-dependent methyltransferase [Verrucomicrobiaceae bacterium]